MKKIRILLMVALVISLLFQNSSFASASTKQYGSLKGNITWQYNEYVGTKADVGAYVALIPIDTSKIENKKHKLFSFLMETKGEGGIYSAKVDGMGEYYIDDVPVGEYTIVIISKKTTCEERFEYEDDWNTSMDNLFGSFLSKKEFETIKTSIGYQSYKVDTIKIKKNKTAKFSYDFGYTYL